MARSDPHAAVTRALDALYRFLKNEDRGALEMLRRRFDNLSDDAPEIAARRGLITGTRRYLAHLERLVPLTAPWREVEIPAAIAALPTMHCGETLPLLYWLGRSLEGGGDVVEVGAWLGGATRAIALGMDANPHASRASIVAVDTFRWETWMAKYLPKLDVPVPRCGESYLDLFATMCAAQRERIVPSAHYVGSPNGYALSAPSWNGRSIELFVYDIGTDPAEFAAAWKAFSPGFVAMKTVVVIGEFCKLHAYRLRDLWCTYERVLTPIHKPTGSAKAFRYEGGTIIP